MPSNGVRRDDGAVSVTSRVARQTNRWVRFAKVTVQVVSATIDLETAVRLPVGANAYTRVKMIPAPRLAYRNCCSP